MTNFLEQIAIAGETIKPHLNSAKCAVILGSGLSDLVDANAVSLHYSDIPGVEQPSIMSHAGKISVQVLGDESIAFCQGRIHLYEGYSAQQVAFLTYALQQAGIEKLIITNAAGGLNPNYQPGDVMIIEDHINLTGHNPVLGQGDELGTRFTDLTYAYEPSWIALAQQRAADLNINTHRGVYAGVLGPTLETKAERRMLRTLGGDAVGMSTIMEVIAANHCGMQVLGLSAITNMATGEADQQPDTLEEVLENAAVAGEKIKQLITALVS